MKLCAHDVRYAQRKSAFVADSQFDRLVGVNRIALNVLRRGTYLRPIRAQKFAVKRILPRQIFIVFGKPPE